MTLNDSASVHHNTATGNGGGIFNQSVAVLNDNSSVHDNSASRGGGAGNAPTGSLTLNDSASIHDNAATNGGGGGINNNDIVQDGLIVELLN